MKEWQRIVRDAISECVLREGIFAVRGVLMGMLEQLLSETKGPTKFFSFICIQRRSASRHSLLNVKGNLKVPTKDGERKLQ